MKNYSAHQRFFLILMITALVSVAGREVAAEELSQAGSNTSALQASAFPVNIYGRDSIDLSGPWQYIIDPMREGLRQPPKNIRNFAKDAVAQGNQLIEYEWDSSPSINVPGDWNTQVEQLGWYEGLLWYRKKISVQKELGKRYFVYFEGANYWKRVSLNNQVLGEHEGGFSPFAFEISEQLNNGQNSLVVAVDNTREAQQIPSLKYDWFNYGGITRPVHILAVPNTYLHDYRVWLSDQGEINVHVVLNGNDSDTEVSVELAELGLSATRRASNGEARFMFSPSDLIRWSPDNPKRYEISIRTALDSISEQIGLRTVSVEGSSILLNGEPVFLKGISVHEEAIGATGGRTLDWESARELLSLVKELGGNYVRLAHYPHTEKMTRLADEMGLLVWSEIPLWQELEFSNTTTQALAKQMQTEQVRRDFNRASIIFWSVANETPQTDERLMFLRQLIDHTRALDDTRLISSALDKNSSKGNTFIVNDPLGEYLDVFSVNTYEGWYGDRAPHEIGETSWTSIYQKPMLFSEFGAGAKAGFHSRGQERWTEEYQLAIYRETLALAENTPLLQGMSPWVLKDFKSPRRYHGRVQEYWNRKGLVDETGNPKAAFKVLQNWYKKPRLQQGDRK